MANSKARRFALHWGEGIVAEEARVEGEHHDPALQLLEFDNGDLAVRFCYFNKRGHFQRSPLIIGENEANQLRDAMHEQPRLRAFLETLVG